MRKQICQFFVAVFLCGISFADVTAAILEVCPSGGGCTYEYTGGGVENAIQTAVNAAANGDTVYIHNGTYSSPQIDMTSAHTGITIEGESKTGTILSESYFRIGSAENGASSNITVKNLHIKDSYDVSNGIEIVNSTGIVLRNLLITGSGGEGLKISGSATVDIYNCSITTGKVTGIRINGSNTEVKIYNTGISGNTYQGILVEDVKSLNIINNGVESNGTVGIQINSGDSANIRNNNIYKNGTYGLNVNDVTSLINDYNNVYENTSGGYAGSIIAGIHSTAIDPDTDANGIPNCTSGLINSGDPSIHDVDGTISDIGIYGGPYSGWNSLGYICPSGLFCHVTDFSHSCVSCLSDTDCPANYTCDLETNSCKLVESGGEEEDEETGEETQEEEKDGEENLPKTNSFSEDPLFYTILSIFLILLGYIFYAQNRYGNTNHNN